MKESYKNRSEGFGVIEIIVAVAIFVIIAVTGLTTVVQTFATNRLGTEESEASFYAQEGLEAVRSIKNQDWVNLSPGTYGLDNSSGAWSFSGTSDTRGKFTRQILIEEVYKDPSGNIVVNPGTLDPDTYRVISSVTWEFSSTRLNETKLVTYLSNWGKALPTPSPTPTPTPTSTPSPSPSVTATPTPTTPAMTCNQFCIDQSFTVGICRQNSARCNKNGETYQSGGDTYCTGGAAADTCCCK